VIFRRALERGNLPAAEAAAKELPKVSLDALQVDAPDRAEEPRRHRMSRRVGCSEERPLATIDEAAMVAASLGALASDAHEEAARTLRGPWAKERLGADEPAA
jgi:hypothetical protein